MIRRSLASFVFLPLAILIVLPAWAQDANSGAASRKTELLWPDGAPGAGGEKDGDVPQLIITQVASELPTAAVVILPGGGTTDMPWDMRGMSLLIGSTLKFLSMKIIILFVSLCQLKADMIIHMNLLN